VNAASPPPPRRAIAFYLAVSVPATAFLLFWVVRSPGDFADPNLLGWVLLIAVIELVPVPATGGVELTLSFPLLIAVSMLYSPVVAGALSFLGAVDLDSLRRRRRPDLVMWFNHAQSGLAAVAGSVCYHAVAGGSPPTWRMLVAAGIASVPLYGTSVVLVLGGLSLWKGIPFLDAVRRMHGAAPLDQLAAQLGLGLFGVVVAGAFQRYGIWSVVLLLGAIVLARQLYFRNRALANQLAEQNSLLTEQAGEMERLLAEVRDKEERFRALIQNASDVILVVGTDAVVGYQSPSAERGFGYGPDELVGVNLIERLLHPDDQRRALALLDDTLVHPGATAPAEWRIRHPRGLWQHVEVIGRNLVEDPRVGGIVLTIRSIEERRALIEQLRHQAFHDTLTGLANRSLFRDRVDHALSRRQAQPGSVAVMFLDLDDFKVVNDSLGHQAGDQLLVTVAERLRACLRPMDTAARLGGDEFAILLEDAGGTDGAIEVAERIIDLLRLPVLIGTEEVFVHGSLGIAASEDAITTGEMLRNADLAMYAAKAAGKGTYEVFRPTMHEATLERMQLNADLQVAIDLEQLVLHYQPIVDLQPAPETAGGDVTVGLEALVRWQHPERGLMAPDSFVSMAEDSGLIVPLGQWVLTRACQQAQAWREAFPAAPRWVSVNLSARQLAQPDLVDQVRRALADTGLDPALLMIELTESLLMQDTEGTIGKLRDLKEIGVRLAIDDFGTGYSSLSYLRRFPVDVLKVGKTFIDGLTGQTDDGALARAIVNLGHTLHLATVAEGVTNLGQVAQLRSLGCQFAQGFLFFEPLEAARATELLAAGGRTDVRLPG
jgi:diguanylate cyclase (GGDEF)-like protein/PAS domain S-box-containing protein